MWVVRRLSRVVDVRTHLLWFISQESIIHELIYVLQTRLLQLSALRRNAHDATDQ